MRFHQPKKLEIHFPGVSEKQNVARSVLVFHEFRIERDTNMCARLQMCAPTSFRLYQQAFGEIFLVFKESHQRSKQQ